MTTNCEFHPRFLRQDNCPHHYNAGQSNVDGDPFGDECDNCPYVTNKFQGDIDKDGIGDVCDKDVDGDGKMICSSFVNFNTDYFTL